LKVGDDSVGKLLAGVARAYGSLAHRAQANSSTPLGFAEFLGLSMPLAIHFVVTGRSFLERALCVAYVPLAIFAIVLTDSRLGMVASLLAPALYVFFWGVRRWRTRRADMIAPTVVLSYPAMFCLFVAATFFIGRLRAKVWGNGAQDASNESRQVQWATGMPKVWEAPWGHGQGRAGIVLGYFAADGSLTIDSYFLSLLLEFGFIGFAIYVAFFLRSAWIGGNSAFRSNKDREIEFAIPLAISLLNFLVIKSVFSQDDNHPLAFMMAAGCLALTYRSRLERDALVPPSRDSRKTVGRRRIA
jgi:O-antigen ligase